jgi:translation initiation factor 5A
MVETQATIKTLKPGSYVMIEDEPCKVTKLVKSKPGKHGASKVRLEGVGIFDGKKRTLLKPGDANVDIPIIEKKKAQVISVLGETVQLMDLDDYSTFEANIPDEFKGKLSPGASVLYWKFRNKTLIKDVK